LPFADVWFQSHNGAIAALMQRQLLKMLLKVSIPQWCDCCYPKWKLQNNSISVSIPQWCDCCLRNSSLSCTEDRVSIPQWCDCCCLDFPPTHATSLVSIPQWCDCCQDEAQAQAQADQRFNPTMVRLLLIPQWFAEIEKFLFQSHNGAIAAGSSLMNMRKTTLVSIPQWCDCCVGFWAYHPQTGIVSIPQWCDCCILP